MRLSVKFKDRNEGDGNVEGSDRSILNSLSFYSLRILEMETIFRMTAERIIFEMSYESDL